MNIRNATDSSINEILLKNKKVLIDFWAPWCGPCKALGIVLEEVSKEIDNINIIKVNVDENPETAIRFKVRSIPTLILAKNGIQIDAKIGGMNKEPLIQWINKKLI